MATLLSSIVAQVRTHLRELPSLTTPAAPTVTPQGTTGAATWTYKIEALSRDQTSIASAAGSTATGNATLSSTNFNRITWAAVTGATAYRIYRTAVGSSPTTTGVIALVGATLQLDDTGLAGDSAAAPSAATGGVFWSDAELLALATLGAKDLWAAFLDIYGDHYLTVDETNVSIAANATSVTGVPADTFRVHLIEPRDTTISGQYAGVLFVPRKYNHPEFIQARAFGSFDPTNGGVIYYDVSGAGSPVGTPTILVAPKLSAAMTLRFVYNPTLGTLTAASNNPVPGESDMALIAYTVAFARAKERDDFSPDPNWIAIYSTEKQSLLTRSTPRQDQEPDMVEGMFEGTYY